MQKEFHPQELRGRMELDWLKARYSFSFANWINRHRLHFGQLRVLNEDRIAGGGGFGTHPHDNMEIVTIPLSGALEHRDSMGSHGVIEAGEVQVMSAGTGITHSEHNARSDEECHLLQIWVIPDARGHTPRYEQKAFTAADRQGHWQTLVSPWNGDGPLQVHQECWFRRTELKAGQSLALPELSKGQGFYLFVIRGDIELDGQILRGSDALEIREAAKEVIKATDDSDVLLIEVPLH